MTAINLSGGVILVTGGSGSIGGATAVELARAGAAVVVADVSMEACLAVVETIRATGGSASAARIDVRDADSLTQAIETATAELGPLTGLVNAAGILRVSRIEEMKESDWNDIQSVNVLGTFLATKAAIPFLKAAGGGTIVNISSVSAYIGSDGGAAYSATKGAVLSFTYGAAGELAPDRIRVNAVCPGWVDGGFTHQAMADAEDPEALADSARSLHYLGRMATATDVGNAVTWLSSDLAAFITGTALFVDGGFMIKRGC